MRLALVACLVTLLTAGCAGPFDDGGGTTSFERMESFSVVLVANGLLTGGPQPAPAAAETEQTAPTALVTGSLNAADTPATTDAASLDTEATTAVTAALAAAAPVIKRQTTAVNGRIEQAGGVGSGPALLRLAAAARSLATKLGGIDGAPTPVIALSTAARRAGTAARDLRTAIAAGQAEDASKALTRYQTQATTANGLVASLGLPDWPADRRLFP